MAPSPLPPGGRHPPGPDHVGHRGMGNDVWRGQKDGSDVGPDRKGWSAKTHKTNTLSVIEVTQSLHFSDERVRAPERWLSGGAAVSADRQWQSGLRLPGPVRHRAGGTVRLPAKRRPALTATSAGPAALPSVERSGNYVKSAAKPVGCGSLLKEFVKRKARSMVDEDCSSRDFLQW